VRYRPVAGGAEAEGRGWDIVTLFYEVGPALKRGVGALLRAMDEPRW
jgi:hypothetical protein